MQIVIDIPEEMYQKIKETSMVISGRRSGERIDFILFNAVNTGTPLPKGHGRLIDADKLYNNYVREPEEFKGGRSLMNLFREAPTIIEADKESEDKE